VNKFREKAPCRTCKKAYKSYTKYKSALAKDFNNRCGYSDCPDFWFGGKNNFHIDHFLPWKKFPLRPELKTSYANLVYACSYINILKSDDLGPYLDPCDVDFNEHFERDAIGNIIPRSGSTQAVYMYKALKLFMRRYQIIWTLDRLHFKMKELSDAINKSKDKELQKALTYQAGELGLLMSQYIDYLQTEQ
jgi:hypothetical protein